MKKQVANTIYIIQNLAIPTLIYFFVFRELSVIAYLLVLLSKWRTVAVSPHFWAANIRSNACDLIVGLSTVALMSSAPVSDSAIINPILAVFYAIWLLAIKPRSEQGVIAAQAFICQFYGLTALYLLADFSISSTFTWIIIPLAWVVARAGARHFLSAYSDVPNRNILISLWSLFVIQLAWAFWVWNIIYPLPGGVFAIPLISLLTSVFGYVAGSVIIAQRKGKFDRRFGIQQGLFVFAVLVLVLTQTNWTGQL